jgi:hypothetical protein
MPRLRSLDYESLPRSVFFKHGAYYLVHKNKWIRLGSDKEESLKAFAEAVHALGVGNRSYKPKRPKFEIPNYWANELLRTIKKNAAKRNLDVAVSKDDLLFLLERSKLRCEATGIRFSFTKVDGCRARPWAPSVDRIDNTKGYVIDNIRLVCAAFNIARSDWPDSVFGILVKAIKRKF